jgi:DNA-binding GntR family transcriptional regulator
MQASHEGVSFDHTEFLSKRYPNPALPASQRIYEILRDRILNLDLEPDTTLSRVDIAKSYEVSQTPVREAVQRLEQEGLLRVFPQSRTVVSRIDTAELRESHFLRVAVESEIARRLAREGDPDKISKARSIVKMQKALGENIQEVDVFNALDEAFHEALYAATGQTKLHWLVRSRSGHMTRARRLELPWDGKMKSITKQHDAILNAIDKGDEVAAVQAVHDHLSGTILRLSQLVADHPGFFKTEAS